MFWALRKNTIMANVRAALDEFDQTERDFKAAVDKNECRSAGRLAREARKALKDVLPQIKTINKNEPGHVFVKRFQEARYALRYVDNDLANSCPLEVKTARYGRRGRRTRA